MSVFTLDNTVDDLLLAVVLVSNLQRVCVANKK